MFYHAYDSYIHNAYPYDELHPITCSGFDTWGRYEVKFYTRKNLKIPKNLLIQKLFFNSY